MNLTSMVAPVLSLDPVSKNAGIESVKKSEAGGTFESIYQSAIGLISETNRYTHEAEEAQISYALGLNDNIHDLLVAQNKANLSLQYTVAIRNSILDAYKELMQMQF